jgi:phosphoribosyl-dephospho-CoA transferase
MSEYRRHDLVWLAPLAIRVPERDEESLVSDWILKERPFVVRRKDDPAEERISLGFQQPIAQDKQKIFLSVTQDKITRKIHPLQLSEILNMLPPSVLDRIEEVLFWANRIDLQPRVYGSFSWQALTGETYVTENSDLDLLWYVRHPDQMDDLLNYLNLTQKKLSLKIDGEIIFPNHQAIAWRELQMKTQDVLVKSSGGVELISRDRIGEFFDQQLAEL